MLKRKRPTSPDGGDAADEGSAPAPVEGTAVVWLRKCLRLDDNAALLAAASGTFANVVVAFTLDPHFASAATVCAARYQFLLEALQDLDAGLQRRYGPDRRLVVLRGRPTEALAPLLEDAEALLFEADVEPYAVQRDAAVTRLARERGVAVRRFEGHTLYPLSALVAAVGTRKPPTTMRGLQSLLQRSALGSVPAPVDPPSALQPLPAALLERVRSGELAAPAATPPYADCSTPGLLPGGESAGLQRLEAKVRASVAFVCGFEKPATTSVALSLDGVSTTLLSPYLKFGCLSARRVYAEVRAAQAEGKAAGLKITSPPGSLIGQLLFRELAYLLAAAPGGFDAHLRDAAWLPQGSEEEQARLAAWEEGRTGFPFIDASMRQLRATGWLHHLQRHAVACFLTRGDLWVDWRRGMAVFDRLLLDSDWALNTHNWMALAGVAPWSPPYFRVYSPEIDPRKKTSLNVRDPDAAWLKRWLPELAALPPRAAYQPWTAPGAAYPERIVVHKAAVAENMGKFKASRLLA